MANELSDALGLELSKKHFSATLNTLLRVLDHEDWESDDLEVLRELADDICEIASEFKYEAKKMVRNIKREQRRNDIILENEHPGRMATARAMLEKGLISEEDISEYCDLDLKSVKLLAVSVNIEKTLLQGQQQSAAQQHHLKRICIHRS